MPKVRWVLLHGFCSKFHALSSNATLLNIAVRIWQSYRDFKGGNFFETQCRMRSTVNEERSLSDSSNFLLQSYQWVAKASQDVISQQLQYLFLQNSPGCVSAMFLKRQHQLFVARAVFGSSNCHPSFHKWQTLVHRELSYSRETARRMLHTLGVGHFERKFETEVGIAHQQLLVSEN